jgi:hypothetical protein
MGLVFMGAIVLPVYLVPALTLVLALGLAAESWSAWRGGRQAAEVSRSRRPFQSHSRYRQTMRPPVTRYMSTKS